MNASSNFLQLACLDKPDVPLGVRKPDGIWTLADPDTLILGAMLAFRAEGELDGVHPDLLLEWSKSGTLSSAAAMDASGMLERALTEAICECDAGRRPRCPLIEVLSDGSWPDGEQRRREILRQAGFAPPARSGDA